MRGEEKEARGGISGSLASCLHAGWQAMHQKMTSPPFFLK